MCETFSRVRTLVGRIAIGSALCLAATNAFEIPARADGYPDRTVRIIVPFPAGATADLLPRAFADWLSRKVKCAGSRPAPEQCTWANRLRMSASDAVGGSSPARECHGCGYRFLIEFCAVHECLSWH